MDRIAKIWNDTETHRSYLRIDGYCVREKTLMCTVNEAYDILCREFDKKKKDSGIDYERRCAELETVVADLVKTVNTLTAMMKPIVFVAEDEDKVAKIKKFLNENTLDI